MKRLLYPLLLIILGAGVPTARAADERGAPTAAEQSTPAVAEQGATAADEPGSLLPGVVIFGLGAAGFIVGSVTAGLVAIDRSEAWSACQADQAGECAGQLSQVDADGALGTTAAVGFSVGAAGMLAGLALVLWRPGGDEGGGEAVAIRGGPGAVELTWRF